MVYAGYTLHMLDGPTPLSLTSLVGGTSAALSSSLCFLRRSEWGVRKIVHEGRGLLLLQSWYIDHLGWKRPLKSSHPINCNMSEVRPLSHFTWTWHSSTPYQNLSLYPGQKTQGDQGQQTLLFPPHLLRHHRLYLIYP